MACLEPCSRAPCCAASTRPWRLDTVRLVGEIGAYAVMAVVVILVTDKLATHAIDVGTGRCRILFEEPLTTAAGRRPS